MFFRKFLTYLPALCWSALIFTGCLLPGSALPKEDFLDKIHFDKIVHFVMYFILFLLLTNALKKDFKSFIAIAATLCISQGIAIECLQGSGWISHRSFEFADIAANIAGICCAYIFTLKRHKTN
jgi:VanZ family protein